MPEIPTAGPIQETQYEPMSPAAARAPFAELERAGERGEQLAERGIQNAESIQRAQDHVATLKFENQFNGDLYDLANSHKLDNEYETMGDRIQKETEALRKKYEEHYQNNPRIWPAIQNHIDNRLLEFKDVMTDKMIGLMKQDNLMELYKSRDEAHQQIAQTDDPTRKEIIKNEFFGKVYSSQIANLLDAKQSFDLVDKFDVQNEETEIVNAVNSDDPKVLDAIAKRLGTPGAFPNMEADNPKAKSDYKYRAEQRLEAILNKSEKEMDSKAVNSAIGALEMTWGDDLQGAHINLSNKSFREKYNLLDENGNPNKKRIEQVKTYLNGLQSRKEETEKIAHDQEEKQIGDLFRKGDYKGVIQALGNENSHISGDENRVWVNAINDRVKAAKDEQKSIKAAAAIVEANDMIARGIKTPAEIRAAIIQNPFLEKEDKEQYINKLETKIDSEIEEGRKLGYSDIKDIIIPPARSLSIEALIQTPSQTRAIKMAQMALDSWIDRQIKDGKQFTRNEVRIQAQQLAEEYAPKAKDKIDELTEEMRKFQEQKSGGNKK